MGFKKFISSLFQSFGAVPYEFTSKVRPFGLPILPVNIGFISVSIFAIGFIAIGIISAGYYSIGSLAIGRTAEGVIAFGETLRSMIRF